MPIFIVRYSEIGLKGPRKRSEMERRLLKNIGASLGDRDDLRIWRERGRIFLEAPDSLKQLVSSSLPTVFGIKSFSECTMIDFTSFEDLVEKS
ncbi:thiamine biosynthesis/tRNA modification protein ThiI, partial [mine drainage metagenome]